MNVECDAKRPGDMSDAGPQARHGALATGRTPFL